MEAVAKILPEEEEEIYYPESDGRPMAETDIHRDLMVGLIEALKDFFRDQPDVYVSGNLLLHFRKGDPSSRVAPDCFVVKGVKRGERRTYKVWEEGKAPDLVIELTSKKTFFEDMNTKKLVYQRELKVKEYFLYDPLGDYLDPQLQGYRLIKGRYQPIEKRADRLHSKVLGLELGVEGWWLRLYNPRTEEKLLTPMEQAEARRKAEEKTKKEIEARMAVEAELVRLRAELEALKKEM